jgi:hypothetical protein
MVERGELGRSEQALPEKPEVAAIREFPAAKKGAAIAPSFRLREESSSGTEVAQFETEECVLGRPPLIGGSQRCFSKVQPPGLRNPTGVPKPRLSCITSDYFRLETSYFSIPELLPLDL